MKTINIVPTVSLACLGTLVLTGFYKPEWHPYLGIFLPLVPVFIEPYWQKNQKLDGIELRNIRSSGMAVMLGLLVTYMTGLGANMGLLPKLIHQIALYPTLLGATLHAIKQLKLSRTR